MFRTLGKKVELYRYKIVYAENKTEQQENCISEEHKNEIEQMLTEKEIEFTTTPIDQMGNEWFNGLEFESYDEALVTFNTGVKIPTINEEVIEIQVTQTKVVDALVELTRVAL